MSQNSFILGQIAFLMTGQGRLLWLMCDQEFNNGKFEAKHLTSVFEIMSDVCQKHLARKTTVKNPLGMAQTQDGVDVIRCCNVPVVIKHNDKDTVLSVSNAVPFAMLTNTTFQQHWRRADTLEPVSQNDLVFNTTQHAYAALRHRLTQNKPIAYRHDGRISNFQPSLVNPAVWPTS